MYLYLEISVILSSENDPTSQGRDVVNTVLFHIICYIELCAYLQYKLSIIHYISIQVGYILPKCAVADKVLPFALGNQSVLSMCCRTPR